MVSGFSLWKGAKSKTYQFQDRVISDFMFRSGSGMNVHRYIGPYQQSAKDASISLPADQNFTNELSIQDVLVLENRDRKYDSDVFELSGVYTMQDPGQDLTQFGLMDKGTISIDFHLNQHTTMIGRKLMVGDVIEPIHLRDYLPLNESSNPIQKFYVVEDAYRPAVGYGPTWFPHLWRVKCTPIPDTQEYRDILHNKDKIDTSDSWLDAFGIQNGTGLGVDDGDNLTQSNATTNEKDLQITNAIVQSASEEVRKRSFFINHLWFKPGNEDVKSGLIRWVLDESGVPPDWTRDFVPSGTVFPSNPQNGDYFIRIDYDPEVMFKRDQNLWRRVSPVWRTEWTPASRVLQSYLKNANITTVGPTDDDTFREKQNIRDIIPVRADILPDTKED